MSDLDLERLRGIAQAATPGPYEHCRFIEDAVAVVYRYMERNGGEFHVVLVPNDPRNSEGDGLVTICAIPSGPTTKANADHIAAFSPSICLQLIQAIQRQPKEATRIEVEGYIAEFVGDPAFVAAALLEKFSVRLKEET